MPEPQLPWARTPPALWVLYTDTFTMAVGFYMLIPLLAIHFLDNLGLSVALVGVLAAVRSFCQHGLMPVSGWIADRIDFRWAISAGVLVRAVGFALLGSADSVTGLVVASVLTGLGGSLFHPASYAAYAALTEGLDTVRVYATRELLSNLGFVVGPVVGSAVAGLDFRWVSFTSAALFLLAFVVTVVGLPGGLAGEPGNSPSMRAVLADRAFVRYCVLAGAVWLLVSQLYLLVPLRATSVLPDTIGLGVVYSASAVLMVVTMLPLTRFVSARLGKGPILACGAVGLAAGICTMGAWGTTAGLLVGIGLFTVGQMLTQPVMSAVVAGFATPGATASYFGVQGIAQAVGGVVGNVGGGLLYTLASGTGLVAWTPWLAFALWGAACAFFLLRPGIVR
ncbi:MFS transporter, DHA1 family, multidrug resistance protein [Sanguibacter gelidistatuariae]|uniref:MFS transporter, DHA1 family, multidrug resistance protein n=1 Tax=Sanguibacter gelidistatuariae TaxID=1814289 RepID=A0A1G6WF03_9MICO|nr:MFS transporter [Sanguibacter gelidistatuariae]SDD63645.1 MFS transporter, DHA1 family, multidrug resistance protein [Sanguibacter gelidistatuariae]